MLDERVSRREGESEALEKALCVLTAYQEYGPEAAISDGAKRQLEVGCDAPLQSSGGKVLGFGIRKRDRPVRVTIEALSCIAIIVPTIHTYKHTYTHVYIYMCIVIYVYTNTQIKMLSK